MNKDPNKDKPVSILKQLALSGTFIAATLGGITFYNVLKSHKTKEPIGRVRDDNHLQLVMDALRTAKKSIDTIHASGRNAADSADESPLSRISWELKTAHDYLRVMPREIPPEDKVMSSVLEFAENNKDRPENMPAGTLITNDGKQLDNKTPGDLKVADEELRTALRIIANELPVILAPNSQKMHRAY